MGPGDVETHLLEFVLPPNPGRRLGWGRLGPGLGQLGRRPLVMAVVDAWTVEEEEEVESPEVALHERLYWSMAAAREPMD